MKFEQLASSSLGGTEPDRGESSFRFSRARELEMILNVVKTINRSLVLSEVLQLVLENSIRVAKAERGFLLLTNQENKLECAMACDADGHRLPEKEISISSTVVEDVYSTGESVCIEDALTRDEYHERESILSLELQTILCSPLIVRDEKIGAIYVDSRHIQPVHKNEIIYLFEILAGQAAIAIKNAQLFEKLQHAFEELQVANEQIIKSERMASKGEMAAEVSHELNNLVSVTSLQVQSLTRVLRRYSPEECERKLEDILESVKRIRVFSAGLLERSALKTTKAIGSINETIANILRFVRPLSKYRDTVILSEFDEAIPPFAFDAQQIQQVMLNFLSNAVDSYSQATIQLRTRYLEASREVKISVTDNGPGIPDEVRRKLFNERITTKVNGHGYGLPVCKKIIENHQGSVEIESSLGHGSTFTIALPLLPSK